MGMGLALGFFFFFPSWGREGDGREGFGGGIRKERQRKKSGLPFDLCQATKRACSMTSTKTASVWGEEKSLAFGAQLSHPVQGVAPGGMRTVSCKGLTWEAEPWGFLLPLLVDPQRACPLLIPLSPSLFKNNYLFFI